MVKNISKISSEKGLKMTEDPKHHVFWIEAILKTYMKYELQLEVKFIDIREVTNYHLGIVQKRPKWKDLMINAIDRCKWPKSIKDKQLKEMMIKEIEKYHQIDYSQVRDYIEEELEQYEFKIEDPTGILQGHEDDSHEEEEPLFTENPQSYSKEIIKTI